jgi:hypothetical protein
MDIQEIIIGVLGLIVLYLLFTKLSKSKENMNGIVNDNMNLDINQKVNKKMCEVSGKRLTELNEYIGKNCNEENKDLPNFRNSINNRNWCRVKEEEEIVMDINKNSYC